MLRLPVDPEGPGHLAGSRGLGHCRETQQRGHGPAEKLPLPADFMTAAVEGLNGELNPRMHGPPHSPGRAWALHRVYPRFTGIGQTFRVFTSPSSSFRHLRPVALVRLLLGILLPLLIVGALGEDVLEQQRFAFESPFMLWLHAHSTPALDRAALTLAYVGGYQVIAPVSAVLSFVLWRRSPRAARFFVVAVLGAAALNGVMKLAFHRPRPQLWPRLVQESGAAFPSGHSMYSAAFVTALILLAWNTRFRWLALLLGTLFTLIVGWSRIDLGVHYPTDVLAGWLTGAAWVLGVYGLLRPGVLRTPGVPGVAT